MSLRPRYSLLTLLLLTAAIAVGIKLWRGPHHVVDRPNPKLQDEYTYYRDWDGTKVMEGVRIRRYETANLKASQIPWFPNYDDERQTKRMEAHSVIATVIFDFYRAGQRLPAEQTLLFVQKDFEPDDELKEPIWLNRGISVLRPDERRVWDEAIQHEKQVFSDRGIYAWQKYKNPD